MAYYNTCNVTYKIVIIIPLDKNNQKFWSHMNQTFNKTWIRIWWLWHIPPTTRDVCKKTRTTSKKKNKNRLEPENENVPLEKVIATHSILAKCTFGKWKCTFAFIAETHHVSWQIANSP